MYRLISFVKGSVFGAGLAYFFDPDLGKRRRALVRDQGHRFVNKAGDAADATLRDVQNRIQGTMAEMRSCMSADQPTDKVLVDRVRSKMGRYISHASAIDVEAHDGTIVLSGPILAEEVDDLLYAVNSVRGVEQVEDNLEVHETAENVSALQGGRRRTGEPFELMQEYWSPATRAAAGAVGGLLVLNCLANRSMSSTLFGAVGTGLALRALTNLETRRLLGLRPARGGRRRQQAPRDWQPA